MHAVVVFESLYGNTRAVADAIADGLRENGEVELLPAADATSDRVAAAELLVVGGPTHVHGMSSQRSRTSAADDAARKGRAAPEIEGPALRDWFETLAPSHGARAAAFDTRIDKSRILTGSAAKGISRRLRGHGFSLVGEESFLVEDGDGPVKVGELERARAWGRSLAPTPHER